MDLLYNRLYTKSTPKFFFLLQFFKAHANFYAENINNVITLYYIDNNKNNNNKSLFWKKHKIITSSFYILLLSTTIKNILLILIFYNNPRKNHLKIPIFMVKGWHKKKEYVFLKNKKS